MDALFGPGVRLGKRAVEGDEVAVDVGTEKQVRTVGELERASEEFDGAPGGDVENPVGDIGVRHRARLEVLGDVDRAWFGLA